MLRMLAEQSVPAFHWASTRYLQGRLFFLLRNCCKTVRQLSQIHAHVVFSGFTQKNFIIVKLLPLYAAFNNLPHALQMFDRLRNPSTSVWNQIIKGNALSSDSRKSVQLLNRMGGSLVLPVGYTYTYVINCCAKVGMLGEGEQVYGKALKSGFCSNVFVRSSLVDFYVKSGGQEGVGKARYLFDEMGEINVVTWNSLLLGCIWSGDIQGAKRVFKVMPWRNVVSWTTMIAGCTQNGRCKEALLLFSEMRRQNIEFGQATLVTVLSACAELGDLNLGRWIHSYVVGSVNYKKQPVLVSLNNALINMYASCSEIEAAFCVFKAFSILDAWLVESSWIPR